MKLFLKVVMNQAEINKAEAANQQNEAKRSFYKANPSAEQEELVDVLVPKPIIEEKPLLIDLDEKITLATIGDAGMIQIKYDGHLFNAVYDQQAWEKLEERFDDNKMILKKCACAQAN